MTKISDITSARYEWWNDGWRLVLTTEDGNDHEADEVEGLHPDFLERFAKADDANAALDDLIEREPHIKYFPDSIGGPCYARDEDGDAA